MWNENSITETLQVLFRVRTWVILSICLWSLETVAISGHEPSALTAGWWFDSHCNSSCCLQLSQSMKRLHDRKPTGNIYHTLITQFEPDSLIVPDFLWVLPYLTGKHIHVCTSIPVRTLSDGASSSEINLILSPTQKPHLRKWRLCEMPQRFQKRSYSPKWCLKVFTFRNCLARPWVLTKTCTDWKKLSNETIKLSKLYPKLYPHCTIMVSAFICSSAKNSLNVSQSTITRNIDRQKTLLLKIKVVTLESEQFFKNNVSSLLSGIKVAFRKAFLKNVFRKKFQNFF